MSERIKFLKNEIEILKIKELNNSRKNNRIWLKIGKLDEGLLKENDMVFKEIRELYSELYMLEHIKFGVVG